MSDSTIYTIGTALNRARDNDIPVQVLVEGEWMTGNVVAVDGHGVVLHADELEHAVVRMEAVSAVRIFSGASPRRTGRSQDASRSAAVCTRASVAVNATRTCCAPARP